MLKIDDTRQPSEARAITMRLDKILKRLRRIALQLHEPARTRSPRFPLIELRPCDRGRAPGLELIALDGHRIVRARLAWITVDAPVVILPAYTGPIVLQLRSERRADLIGAVTDRPEDWPAPDAALGLAVQGMHSASGPTVLNAGYLADAGALCELLGPLAHAAVACRQLDGPTVIVARDIPESITVPGDEVLIATMAVRPDHYEIPEIGVMESFTSKPKQRAKARATEKSAVSKDTARAVERLRAADAKAELEGRARRDADADRDELAHDVTELRDRIKELEADVASANNATKSAEDEADELDRQLATHGERITELEEAANAFDALRLGGRPVTVEALCGPPARRSWEMDRVAEALSAALPGLVS